MRKLSADELELIIGASSSSNILDTVYVFGTNVPDMSWIPPWPVFPTSDYVPLYSGGSTPTCASVSQASGVRIDLSYIRANEGGLMLVGYALNPSKFPNSGVTIGRGVDLGMKTTSQLSGWGISSAGLATLTPYLGATGQKAVNLITNRGAPTISVADATAISNGAEADIFSAATRYFNGQNPVVRFENLPSAAQTVLADIAYNLGSLSKAPTFTTAAVQGRWLDAISELRNWTGANNPDPLTNRHNADADLLQASLLAGALPGSGCV